MLACAEQRGRNRQLVVILERLDRHARGDAAVERHFDDVVRGDRLQRRRGLAQRQDIVPMLAPVRLRGLGEPEYLQRAGTGGQAAEETPFFQGAYQPVYARRSEEHTSELRSLMRTSYAVFCLKKKKKTN